VKVGALVALGFGEAGVKIISDNMGHTGDVDPMVPGHKVAAIFGFCTIRQFIETTEVLEESVMSFVNEIAELVHGVVDKFSGAPNKNIGDSFLCVWKFRDEDIEFNENTNNIQPIVCTAVQQLADMALISYLKTIAALKRSAKLEGYRVREDMQEKMSKNFEVKMGFGLHIGWAIEGAIGSEFKIDASYLSPNVNMASRLEAATKQFGVSILMSGSFFSLLTPKCQEY
jgi:class 3 adenylate cyclase